MHQVKVENGVIVNESDECQMYDSNETFASRSVWFAVVDERGAGDVTKFHCRARGNVLIEQCSDLAKGMRVNLTGVLPASRSGNPGVFANMEGKLCSWYELDIVSLEVVCET